MVEHVHAVLRDARRHEVELPPLRPEPAEVLDDRGVPEQALRLVDVEPGGHAPLEVPVHPVAHALEDGDDPERAHVLGEVLEVDVGYPPLERDVRRVVEEGERPRHVPLVAQGYVAPLALGLGLEDAVEVPEQRDAALAGRLPVRLLDASADDRLVRLGQALVALGHGRAREGEEGVYLERHLRGAGLVRHVGEVEGVQVRVGVGGEPYALAAVRLDDGGVLPRGVEDDDLVVGVGEDGVLYLALDREGLARPGLAGDEPHGARQLLAVAKHQVRRLLVLAVVAAALVRELLRREGHLDGHLRRRHHARDLDVVVAERQDGVQPLPLPVVEGVRLDGVAPRGRHDLHHLVVELVAGSGVGVDEARVHVEALVLVLEVVEQVLGLLLRVLELRGEYLEVVALLHRAHLLVDDLLVHPRDALLDEGDRLGLVEGLDVDGDGERHRQVDDVGDAPVGQLASEPPEHEHLAPRVARLEARGAALGLEVERRRADEVLRREPAAGADRLPREHAGHAGAQKRVQRLDALGAGEGARRAPHLGEGLLGVPPHPGELGHGGLEGGRPDGEGEVAVADEVGDPLAQLVVQDPVVLRGVARGARVVRREEPLRPDLLGGDGAVHHRELDAALRAEVVEQLAPSGEDRPLALLPRRLVADVVEGEGLAEQALLDLRYAVFVQKVVPDRRVDVLRRPAKAPLLRHASRELALLLGDAPLERLPPLAAGLFRRAPLTVSRHSSPPPSSCSSCGRAGRRGRRRRFPPPRRACCPSRRRALRPRGSAAPAAPGTSRREAPSGARTPRARTASTPP